MTIEALNQEVDQERGKSGGWPEDLIYTAQEEAGYVGVTVTVADSAKYSVWKRIDPWGMAFFDRVKGNSSKPLRLTFSVQAPKERVDKYQYEVLKRRLSFLAEANHLEIALMQGSLADSLYSWETLTSGHNNERVHGHFRRRSDNTAGHLEKDFQTWLLGRGKSRNRDPNLPETNERLALFGPDFVRIKSITSAKNQDGFKVEREFPIGAFKESVKEANRILTTEFVDLVTLNRWGDLAVIEIKFDDPKLEVISQVLNYALFFCMYRSQLTALLDEKLGCKTEGRGLVTYLVSNTFHKKFKSVWPYYSQRKDLLNLKRVVMGNMPEEDPCNAP
jgi:hypothetical protein